MAVKPIPEGYHTLTPYLVARDAAAAIDFYRRAFGAEELVRMPGPDGKVAHAELRIGDCVLMLGEESADALSRSPRQLGGTTVGFNLDVPDCDAMFQRAVASGATVLRKVENQFYGDRSGTVADPFGHQWTISTHVEDVSPEEMARRAAKAGG